MTFAQPLRMHFLSKFSLNFLITLIPNILQPLLINQLLQQIIFFSFIVQFCTVFCLYKFLQQKESNVFQDYVEDKFTQSWLLEVVILKYREHYILNYVNSVYLEIQFIEISLHPQQSLPLVNIGKIKRSLYLVALGMKPLHKVQQILATPPDTRISLQTLYQNLYPHQRKVNFPLNPIFLLIYLTPSQQSPLQIYQFTLNIHLLFIARQIHTHTSQQLLPTAKYLVKSASKRVNIDLCVVDTGLTYLWSFVVVGAAVGIVFGVVGVSHLSYSKIYQKHGLNLVLLNKHQIGRFEISMNNSHPLLLLLPFLFSPIIPHNITMQIIQNLCTPIHKVNHILFPHIIFNSLRQRTTIRIFCYQVEVPTLGFEDVNDIQDETVIPMLQEVTQDYQLSIPVILVTPFV